MEGFTLSPPKLDHVSLVGIRADLEQHGFRVTWTTDSGDHGRVFLDGTYLELVPPNRAGGPLGARGWFLRPDDPQWTADHLRAVGILVEGPTAYLGADGTWLDIEVAEPADPALPLLTRRTDLADSAWPPRSVDAHPNGAHRLTGLRVQTRDPPTLTRLLVSLGITRADEGKFILPQGEMIELQEGSEGHEGVIGLSFECKAGPSIWLSTWPISH